MFNKLPFIIILYCCLVVFHSCSKKIESVDEIKKYIEDVDNGLIFKKNNNHYTIEAMYWPTVLMNHKEGKLSGINTKDEQIYFKIKLSNKNEPILNSFIYDENLFNKALHYLAFSIKNDFEIIDDKGKSTSCKTAIFHRTYGMIPYNEVIVVFKNPFQDDIDFCELEYIDNLTGLGSFKHRFNKNSIEKLQRLMN